MTSTRTHRLTHLIEDVAMRADGAENGRFAATPGRQGL